MQNRNLTRRAFYVTAATAFASIHAFGNTKPKTRVFILSGQSNCGGAGNGDLLPTPLRAKDPQALLFSKYTANRWQPLAPYKRTAEKFGIEKEGFGPELGFGREMRKAFPDDSICIIKQSSGGTSVVAWDKNHGTEEYTALMKEAGHIGSAKKDKPPQYPVLLKTIQDALALLDQPCEISGFLWFQAEADAKTERLASQWSGRVVTLLDNLAEDVGFSSAVPLMVMDSHFPSKNLQDKPHGEQIVPALLDYAQSGAAFGADELQKKAGLESLSANEFMSAFQAVTGRGSGFFDQADRISKMKRDIRKMAAERPKTAVIDVDDLPTYEGVHFTTAGQVEIGKRLAFAYKKSGAL
ncbi:hypothetical protein PDESU_03460 [Pontiella desulfatans]|uniref:Sialate O-acetylesterase domain-containing protein n=1 Tax=Pontiella desulfatans TaxID=2750659 RepID=A0A6C2U4I5_PONDE|nr:sialate O-acetylesterase [Pontiella desulfatans]VGO14890.1 hypothetical protein PDESU_03460 [Pontiella desulfatans]